MTTEERTLVSAWAALVAANMQLIRSEYLTPGDRNAIASATFNSAVWVRDGLAKDGIENAT